MANVSTIIQPGQDAEFPTDILWPRLRRRAEEMRRAEPALSYLVSATVLGQASLDDALAHRLAARLAGPVSADALQQLFREVLERHPALRSAWRFDLSAVLDRDPATSGPAEPILFFKGFQGAQAHRIAHALWVEGRRDLALYLADRASEVLQVDIHPAARLGAGLFIDHATDVVIGDTAVVGDNVSLLQGVLLGGDGREVDGRRHPSVGHGVMIGADAKLLGPIAIGHCSRVGAGSIVTESVAPNTTVAGMPARVLGPSGCAEPSRTMNQMVFDVGL